MATANRYHHGNLREAILQRAAEVIGEEGIEALSLRGIARDLGVSHGAPNRHFKTKAELLTELGAEAWLRARNATLEAAETCGSQNPHVRLNAMGRGYLRWALQHGPLLAVIQHPDINRYATEKLNSAMSEFRASLLAAVKATQEAGRHPEVDTTLLTLFTNSVPYGLASLMHDERNDGLLEGFTQEQAIAELIELVVPIKHLTND
ncbi:MAG: TetR/AcrR family transcriptional regulator [Pseudomonadales bacterium]